MENKNLEWNNVQELYWTIEITFKLHKIVKIRGYKFL